MEKEDAETIKILQHSKAKLL